jgi:hypothetical protein
LQPMIDLGIHDAPARELPKAPEPTILRGTGREISRVDWALR